MHLWVHRPMSGPCQAANEIGRMSQFRRAPARSEHASHLRRSSANATPELSSCRAAPTRRYPKWLGPRATQPARCAWLVCFIARPCCARHVHGSIHARLACRTDPGPVALVRSWHCSHVAITPPSAHAHANANEASDPTALACAPANTRTRTPTIVESGLRMELWCTNQPLYSRFDLKPPGPPATISERSRR